MSVRRWFVERFAPLKDVSAWWALSQAPCDDGYVRGVRKTQPADKAKLRLPSKADPRMRRIV